jgi:predicted nucleotidyltransferase
VGLETNWREALERELDTVDFVFPRDVRAVYLHGSRAEGSALDDSDIDLTVVVNGPVAMATINQALAHRRLSTGQRLDAQIDTLEILTDPFWAFIAARLKYSGDLIRGEDVRAQVREPDFDRFRAVVIEQACKGIAMLRDADGVVPPIGYPVPAMAYFGYEVVRKKGWYPPGTAFGTRELVAVATYCASAWIVTHHRAWPTSKAQALCGIRAYENGYRADLVEGLYALCRQKGAGRLPDDLADREALRSLCQRFLALEAEVLAL